MDEKQYRKNAILMLDLAICAIKGEKPRATMVENIDLAQLFEVCQEHILTACVAYALESVDIMDSQFQQAKAKAIRKNILFDAERKKILERLEQEHIWYMPLKGAILKDWYPKLGMRQMSDNDILCDAAYRARIKEVMLDLGFTCKHFQKGNDDAYYKPPVCNFEMHSELFNIAQSGTMQAYYDNVKTKLIKDNDSQYGYHFGIEDFYLYLTAHELKHFSHGGIGVRTLVDTYVIINKYGNDFNWDYLNSELQKLKMADFEKQNRELSMKLFSRVAISKEDEELLDYYIFSGTYGTIENVVNNKLECLGNGSKFKYIFQRLFPSMDQIQIYWNFFYRHKYLIPVLWIYRPFHALLVDKTKYKQELKYLLQKKPKK